MQEININISELLKLLKHLISINSVNPILASHPNGETEIARFLGNYMNKMGLEVHYQEIEENRTNVIGILRGQGGGKSLMLNGHTDTVGVEGMEEPFNPRIEDGKMYGRGAIDMKSGIASMIIAVFTIISSKIKLKGDVILALVIDEEYASIGTETLLEEFHADAAIVTEPTNLRIGIAHRGFAWIKIEVFGKAAHGSMPDEGVDAIVKAGKVLVELEKLQNDIFPKYHHPLLGSASVHASLISGGLELSTYPDYCKIEIERRTLPHENQAIIKNEIQELLDGIKSSDSEFKSQFDIFFYRAALETPPDEEIAISISKARKQEFSVETEFIGLPYWTDAGLLFEASIPTTIFGPKGEGLHASIEFVEIDSLISTTKILTTTIIDFCS